MVRYRFQLMGVPFDLKTKFIECDPNQSSADLKKIVQREYKLNRALSIRFLFKGAFLPDDTSLARAGIRPDKDVIVVDAFDPLCDSTYRNQFRQLQPTG